MNRGATRVSELIAAFVTGAQAESLSSIAGARIADALTDAFGVGLAGSRQPAANAVARVLLATGGGGSSYLIGRETQMGPIDAALYNGTAIHAEDFDDSSHPSYSHVSSHLLPVILSLAPIRELSGREILLSYAVGLEIEAKLGRVLNTKHYLRGWHTTCTFGSVASAVTAARLLSLDERAATNAIGIAASSASGLRANFGTMVKPLHAGMAARNGVLAALLAQQGLNACEEPMASRYGFGDVMRGDGVEVDWSPFEKLGEPWEIEEKYALAIKPYPSCGATHPAIEAALELHKEIDGQRIVSVRVGTNELAPQTLIYHSPRTGLEAKFSLEYCVAHALLYGTVNRASFREEAVSDGPTRNLMDKIVTVIDERVRLNMEHGATVAVQTRERVWERTVDLAKGKPERWLSEPELLSKFLDGSEGVLPKDMACRLFADFRALALQPSLTVVLEAVVRGGRASENGARRSGE